MGIFSANTEILSETGRKISSLGSEYDSNISGIFTAIDSLSKAWSGGASEQYINSFNSYRVDLNNLGTAIDNMGKALTNAANAFDDNETDLANTAKNL